MILQQANILEHVPQTIDSTIDEAHELFSIDGILGTITQTVDTLNSLYHLLHVSEYANSFQLFRIKDVFYSSPSFFKKESNSFIMHLFIVSG